MHADISAENDTIARIGTSCFQKLVESNVDKLSSLQWQQVTSAFVKLFKVTTPYQLFDESLRVEISISSSTPDTPGTLSTYCALLGCWTALLATVSSVLLPAPLTAEAPVLIDSTNPAQARRRVFQQIITKCVLQLLLIETTSELFQSKAVYETMPPDQLLLWTGVLDHSYQFARSFNEDKELRTGLWKAGLLISTEWLPDCLNNTPGFMKHLPNLLKQESASASTLINVLLRMYFDSRPDHQASKQKVADHMLPWVVSILFVTEYLTPSTGLV
jgi:brefeldin A-inhibited guanine nucleotide-exchange protein